MNNNPEIATQWKGMFLMHVNVRTVENPERCVKQLQEDIIENARQKFFSIKEYLIYVEIGMGISLPKNRKNCKF